MSDRKNIQEVDTSLFLEEIQKRVNIDKAKYDDFLKLWEFRKFARNEFILTAGNVPDFSMFVLKGCLRQYSVNEKGEEAIVYFAEERHFIGDLPAIRSKSVSVYNFQAIEECEILTISAENWEKAFVDFPWWAEAHLRGYQKWAALLQQQLSDLHSKTGELRYLDLLKSKPNLFQRVPQRFIASYLGLSAETLSRIRKKISKP
ncbi:MAG: Crp/Fnr family transcriptional regulator [Bacteroidota bacterium]|nr:Crp/Fnr family transcriptional regulator [Bacteroidota bacterium]